MLSTSPSTQEMLAETNQNPAENSPRKSPTSVAGGTKVTVTVDTKFAGLAMKDEEEECLNCGA
jgi:hypothetical protein